MKSMSTHRMLKIFVLAVLIPTWIAVGAEWPAREVEHFDKDPKWESYRSRLVPNPAPIVRQDFGWRNDNHAKGEQRGEIGGWIQRSITPAYYAKEIEPKTFDDQMSASGKFAVTRNEGNSGSLFGWFNDSSRGWRTPNSLVLRIDGNGPNYWLLIEYGTRHWLTAAQGLFEGAYQTTKTKPFAADGTVHEWTMNYDPAGNDNNGLFTFTLDGNEYLLPLAPGHKADGAKFNRFGLFNHMITGQGMEVYFDDVVLDGEVEGFARDPKWDARGNKVSFAENVIRPMHNFGHGPTAHAGGHKGEVGGIMWRDEKPAYYADQVGPFTLDDELFASGKLAFTAAGSDSGLYLGFFDATSKKNKTVPEHEERQKNMLAIAIEGPSRIGHYFRPAVFNSVGGGMSKSDGPIIRPDGEVHEWSLHYSPTAAGGNGQITVKFDENTQTLDLKPEDRKRGATFDRFGFFNMQTGGHYVFLYADDLSYAKTPSTK